MPGQWRMAYQNIVSFHYSGRNFLKPANISGFSGTGTAGFHPFIKIRVTHSSLAFKQSKLYSNISANQLVKSNVMWGEVVMLQVSGNRFSPRNSEKMRIFLIFLEASFEIVKMFSIELIMLYSNPGQPLNFSLQFLGPERFSTKIRVFLILPYVPFGKVNIFFEKSIEPIMFYSDLVLPLTFTVQFLRPDYKNR